jgi:hypothetical protein
MFSFKVAFVSFYGGKKVRERNVTLTIWGIYKHETVVSPTADQTHNTQTLTLLSYRSVRWPQPLKAVTTNAAEFSHVIQSLIRTSFNYASRLFF